MAVEHVTYQFEDGESPTLKRIYLSPLKAIHYRCRMCTGLHSTKLEKCSITLCPLFPMRLAYPQYRPVRKEISWDDFRKTLDLPLTHKIKSNGEFKEIPLDAEELIGGYCVNCVGSKSAARRCKQHFCSLFPFRPGIAKRHKSRLLRKEFERRGIVIANYPEEERRL